MSVTAPTIGFFETPGRSLREILLDGYLVPAGRWLAGPPASAYLLPQAAGSNWECALAIEYLLDLRGELANERDLAHLIPRKTSQTARWMIEQRLHESNATVSWESVTWDTAVCIRALLRTILELPEQFSAAERAQFAAVSAAGVRWLIQRFRNWDTEVMYPYGPADIAQILETLIYVRKAAPGVIAEIDLAVTDDAKAPWHGANVIDEIAAYLLAAEDDLAAASADATREPEAVAFWADCFQSGEVIDCLASYLSDCTRNETRAQCQAHIVAGIRYFERQQVDGKWGSHADTCRALYGYLRATHAMPAAHQEHHVVMKALRWMCDEKQTFRDGSFMHTPFVTVFYVAALWEVYVHWPPATMPVGAAYDVALWSAPVRATEERGLRLGLQIETERLGHDVEAIERRLYTLRERVAGAVAIVVVIVLGSLTGAALDVFETSASTKDSSTLVEYVAIVLVVALAAGGFVARVARR
ncbi:MAG TPA: hypothetical protein VMI13_12435 [Solirubrobacteraceae bacterium]|nr:hypothetical protein [Solirubrobacteraceae bacterium]